MYREEYPRPNFIRPDWQSLNGPWEFEIADGASHNLAFYLNGNYQETIEVPFSPQSPLSGIGRDENFKSVWYRRTFLLDAYRLDGTVLLNFGAVDFRAEIYINGTPAAGHRGGYTPFTINITPFVKEGENTIVVNALDDDEDPFTPSGNQGKNGFPHCTGIWQSVWLEFASRTYLSAYRATSNLSQKSVIAQGIIEGADKGKIEAELFLNGVSLAKYKYELKRQFFIKIPVGQNLTLWEAGDGKFYDIVYTLYAENGEPLDSVLTYSAFRQIEVKNRTVLLNGKPLTIKQITDNRFYPASHYTAPSEAAIKQDLLCAISSGFNSVRIRGALAEPAYLYYADKLGLILFEEYPSPNLPLNENSAALWSAEWQYIMERDFGHPSIFFWLPIGNRFGKDGDFSNSLCSFTLGSDPSRFVIDGIPHYNTSVFDKRITAEDNEGFLAQLYNKHNGEYPTEKEAEKAAKLDPLMMSDAALAELPCFVSDMKLPKEAYGDTRTFKRYFAAYVNAVMSMRAAGFCFQALFDTPAEAFGFYNAQRDFKFDRAAEPSIRKFLNQIK